MARGLRRAPAATEPTGNGRRRRWPWGLEHPWLTRSARLLCLAAVAALLSSSGLPAAQVYAVPGRPALTRSFGVQPRGLPRPSRTALRSQFASQKGGQKAKKALQKKQEKTEQRKKKDNVIEMDGRVLMHSRNIFKVELENGAEVQCTLAGKLRMNSIKVLEGDKVTVELSPFDLTRGRITFRTINTALLDADKKKKG